MPLDMPPLNMNSEHEPQNIFSEDLFQGSSFIELLQNSSDVNISSYMTDDDPFGLPPLLPPSSELSPIGGSVNVLEMISQDVMLSTLQPTYNASTEVTYVKQNTAPSAALFTGDMLPPTVPLSTAIDTFAKPYQGYVPPASANRYGKTMLALNPTAVTRTSKLVASQSANPFAVNPFIINQTQLLRNSYAESADVESEKPKRDRARDRDRNRDRDRDRNRDRDKSKKSRSSSKKSKSKSHRSHKSSKHSKSTKKSSRSSKSQSSRSSRKSSRSSSTKKDVVRSTTVTHTVTRSSVAITESSSLFTSVSVTHTTTTLEKSFNLSTGSSTWTSLSSATETARARLGPDSMTARLNAYALTRARAAPSIISPLSTNMLYSTPTIISRSPAPTGTPTNRMCEQFTVLPQTCAMDSPRPRTRLVIPLSLNAYVTGAASATTTTASAAHTHRLVHTVRPVQNVYTVGNAPLQATLPSTTTTSTVTGRTFNRGSFALPPGATFYTARKLTKTPHTAATTEPHTFTIVDSKGAYTTLTISSDFSTTSGSTPATQTQSMNVVTPGDAQVSPAVADSGVRPRNQLLIPIPHNQMNTSTSLGYLVTSPVGSDIISPRGASATASTISATGATTNTITTISSDAFNRIRSRLIYNIPGTSSGLPLAPPTTVQGNKSRGPVTIIANQLISPANTRESSSPAPRAVFSAASQNLYAITPPSTCMVSPSSCVEPAPRSVNRVVIPINVHGNSTSNSTVNSPGTFIIAGVGSQSTTGDVVTRPSRVVIPIVHNSNAGSVATTTLAAMPAPRSYPTVAGGSSSSFPSTDAFSKLRNRLTIQVGTTENTIPATTTPITTYTITRTRAPQSVYTLPTGSTPYISSTKTEGSRNPGTMTLITFAPPTTSTTPTVAAPQRSPAATRGASPSYTSATPTISSTGNRFVIKLATGPSAAAATTMSSVTTSITTPITSAAVSPTGYPFTGPQPVSTRLRTFPGPRTYSIAQRTATSNALQKSGARNLNPRLKKVLASPSPLQIFADVVCPPTTTQTQTTATATQSQAKSRFTLSHNPGSSTLVVPQYKNTVFKNLSPIAQPSPDRMSSRVSGPRASSERLVLNRSVALVSPRRQAPGPGSDPAPSDSPRPAPERSSPTPSDQDPTQASHHNTPHSSNLHEQNN